MTQRGLRQRTLVLLALLGVVLTACGTTSATPEPSGSPSLEPQPTATPTLQQASPSSSSSDSPQVAQEVPSAQSTEDYVGLNAAYEYIEGLQETLPDDWNLELDEDLLSEFQNRDESITLVATPTECVDAFYLLFAGYLVDSRNYTLATFSSTKSNAELKVGIVDLSGINDPLKSITECSRVRTFEADALLNGAEPLGFETRIKWEAGSDVLNDASQLRGTLRIRDTAIDGTSTGWFKETWILYVRGKNLLVLRRSQLNRAEQTDVFGRKKDADIDIDRAFSAKSFLSEAPRLIDGFNRVVDSEAPTE